MTVSCTLACTCVVCACGLQHGRRQHSPVVWPRPTLTAKMTDKYWYFVLSRVDDGGTSWLASTSLDTSSLLPAMVMPYLA